MSAKKRPSSALTHPPTHPLTHTRTQSRTHSLTHSPTHAQTHSRHSSRTISSLTHSLTHSHTHTLSLSLSLFVTELSRLSVCLSLSLSPQSLSVESRVFLSLALSGDIACPCLSPHASPPLRFSFFCWAATWCSSSFFLRSPSSSQQTPRLTVFVFSSFPCFALSFFVPRSSVALVFFVFLFSSVAS